MLRENKAYIGALTGLLFPLMIFVAVHELNSLLLAKNILPGDGFRLQFQCIISVVANVIPAGSYVRAHKDNALKGVAGVTLLYVALIIIYFHKGLMNG